MLKFFLLVLVAINAALFAYHQGHLEPLFPSGREPARVSRQLNADKIKLLRPVPSGAVPAASSPGGNAEPAESKASAGDESVQAANTQLTACTEIGTFNPAEARRFETQLAALALDARLTRREVVEAGSHMVLIPPQGSREAAEKKAAELRGFGVNEFYVIQENSAQRWGISLGVFRSEEAARTHLSTLNQKGIRSARLIEYKMPLKKVAFQLRGLAPDVQQQVVKIGAVFPGQQISACS